jgi:hypothetical protein
MARRSSPQSHADGMAFPIQMFVRVPPMGLRVTSDRLHDWLRSNLPRGDYAVHAAGASYGMDRCVVMLRDPGPAVALMAAVPELQLADGTTARGYVSPNLPQGRSGDT